MLFTNLWIPLSCHICLTYKKLTHISVDGTSKVPPFYTTIKRGRLGYEKWKGHDWSLSKDKTSEKVGVGMSGMQPDTR